MQKIQLLNKNEVVPSVGEFCLTKSRKNEISNKPPKLICTTPQYANYSIFNECMEHLEAVLGGGAPSPNLYEEHEQELLEIALSWVPGGVYTGGNIRVTSGCGITDCNNLWGKMLVPGDHLFIGVRFVQVRGLVSYYDIGNMRVEASIPVALRAVPVHYVPQWCAIYSSGGSLSSPLASYKFRDGIFKLAPTFSFGVVAYNDAFSSSRVADSCKRTRDGECLHEDIVVLQTCETQSQRVQIIF